MADGKLKIHSENILPILKKWLYSDHDIFLRELVSNGCDAVAKVKILQESGELPKTSDPFRIDIQIDKEQKTLTISDNGIGMDAEEVEKYIAQLAFSGAEEFVQKYEKGAEKEALIGHFGLGFYSAFIVSKTVEINTLSHRSGSTSAHWICDGGTTYTLDVGTRTSPGTTITLHLSDDSEEYLDVSRLRSILKKHCSYLPVPIYLKGEQINHKDPLWLKAPSECTDEDYLAFYKELYPMDPDPMFWIHLNVDYPFHLKGILYFPKITQRYDHNSSNIKLFCNRVFVSDNCKEIFPDYLTVMRGALDSTDIPLNVSRSHLQMDKTVRQLSGHISKKVSDRLSSLYHSDREEFLKFWPDVEIVVKLGILNDEKFYERSKEFMVWKTLDGEWTTVEEYIERRKEAYQNKIFYTMAHDTTSPFLRLYKEQKIEVLLSSHPIDSAVMSRLEQKLSPAKFQRVDGAADDLLLDKTKEKTLLDTDGKSISQRMAECIKEFLNNDHVEVEAKSLAHDEIPAFVVFDEETRRMRDYLSLSDQEIPDHLLGKQKLIVNTNNSLVSAICDLKATNPALSELLTKHIYDLALLSQKELKADKLNEFIARSNEVLTVLAHKI